MKLAQPDLDTLLLEKRREDMKWNFFDFVLVCVACLDLILSHLLSGNLTNITFMRSLRYFE